MAYTTIDDPEAHFQVKAYTGNYSDAHAITLDGDTDMQPDLVVSKQRDGADAWYVSDAARGTTKTIYWDVTTTEETIAAGIQAFGSDGFTVGQNNAVNQSGAAHVAFCWKANGSGTANSEGNTTTTKTSANTTAGFSIITYEGDGAAATLGHGLGAVPHCILQKNIDNAENWQVYHHKNTSAPETDYLTFNTTNATSDQSSRWNDTAPTSTLISIGSDSSVSQSGESMVIYAWSEKQGFSKFGSFTGNGNADGPFVYTGFKVRWLLVKNAGGAETWNIWDSKRTSSGGGNLVDKDLSTNHTRAEQSGTAGVKVVDFLSNGFKVRGSNTELNQSGNNHIYMAFAEAPFVNSEGVPCTAR